MGKRVVEVRFYPGETVIEYDDGSTKEIKSSRVCDDPEVDDEEEWERPQS